MVADIEELEKMDASELHARRPNAKEVLTPQRSGNFIFPVADGTVKIIWCEQRLITSTITREPPERCEKSKILHGNSDKWYAPSNHEEDSIRAYEVARNDFWTITGEFIYRHHVVRTCRKKKHFLFQRSTLTLPERHTHPLVVLLEKHIEDYCDVDGEKIIRCIDRLHKIYFIERKAT